MGVFGVFFGCRGVVGFSGPLLGACSGDGGFMPACVSGCSDVFGFNVATWLCPVREKVRPARPDVGASAKKFAQRAENTPISAFLGLLGELFRGSAGGEGALGELFRGSADGGAALGEFFRGNAAGSPVLGELFRRHHRTHSRPRCWKATLRELCCGAGVGAPSRPDVPNVPTGTVGISPGGRRGPGAWPARRKAASRRSDSPAPPTRRPSRSTGTSERSRGR